MQHQFVKLPRCRGTGFQSECEMLLHSCTKYNVIDFSSASAVGLRSLHLRLPMSLDVSSYLA